MLNVWSTSTGFNLATVIEGVALERVSTGTDTRIPLPLTLAKSFQGVPPPAFDGTGHHPTAPLRNSAGSSFARSGVNSFADGVYAISTGQLNARVISTLVVKDPVNQGNEADPNGYSGMSMDLDNLLHTTWNLQGPELLISVFVCQVSLSLLP